MFLFSPDSYIMFLKLEKQFFAQNQLNDDYYDDYEEDEEELAEDLDEEIPEDDEL